MDDNDLKELFKKAADVAQTVPESLQQNAFNRALDALVGETNDVRDKSVSCSHDNTVQEPQNLDPQDFKARDMIGRQAVLLPPGGIILEELEQDLIRQALEQSGGRIKEAAELLGLSYKTLQYRLKKHEIDRHAPEE